MQSVPVMTQQWELHCVYMMQVQSTPAQQQHILPSIVQQTLCKQRYHPYLYVRLSAETPAPLADSQRWEPHQHQQASGFLTGRKMRNNSKHTKFAGLTFPSRLNHLLLVPAGFRTITFPVSTLNYSQLVEKTYSKNTSTRWELVSHLNQKVLQTRPLSDPVSIAEEIRSQMNVFISSFRAWLMLWI